MNKTLKDILNEKCPGVDEMRGISLEEYVNSFIGVDYNDLVEKYKFDPTIIAVLKILRNIFKINMELLRDVPKYNYLCECCSKSINQNYSNKCTICGEFEK